MKLFLILSRSMRQNIPKQDVPNLALAHRDYHQPMRQNDIVLLQAMLRPDENTLKGSRCMILQAETLEDVEDFLKRNPLVPYDAVSWTVQELIPNYATECVRSWYKGSFSKGHRE
jgi:hypothetical protein